MKNKKQKINKIQKSLCFILAFLMIAGTIISTLTMIAFGAETITIQNATITEPGNSSKPDKIIKGNKYDIEIQFDIQSLPEGTTLSDIKAVIKGGFESAYVSPQQEQTFYKVKFDNVEYNGKSNAFKLHISYNENGKNPKKFETNLSFDDYTFDENPPVSPERPDTDEEAKVTIRRIDDFKTGREARRIDKGGRYDVYLHVEKMGDIPAGLDENSINAMLGGAFIMDEGSSISAEYAPQNNIDSNNKDDHIGFDIWFRNVKYTGKGNSIDVSLRYEINNTVYPHKLNVSFDEYIFEEYTTPPITPDRPEIDSLTPGIYVHSYSVKGLKEELPNPGDRITLEVIFENTSYDTDLENIRMKIDTGTDFYIEDASTLYRRDYLEADGKFKYVIDLKVNKDIQPKSHTVTFNFEFQYINANDTRTSGTSAETVAIPIRVGEGVGEADSKNPLVPHIIISEYSYGKDSVTAGDNFNLKISCKNTSSQYDLENIVMKITTPQAFSIASSSNSFYIEKLPRNSVFTKEIEIKAKADAEPESHNLEISFDFQYVAASERRDGNSKETIAVPVVQIDRFSVQKIEMPSMLWQGDEVPVSINLINKGKSLVGNVTVEFETEDGSIKESQYIGNVESGKEASGDFFVVASTPGTLKGKFKVSYEDSNLNIKTIERDFNVEIQGMDIDQPTEPQGPSVEEIQAMEKMQKQIENKKMIKNVVLVICGVITAGISAYTTIVNVKKKRSEESDENF